MVIDDVLIYAYRFVGVPYLYGGNNPISGWDCSGFVCEVLKAFGVLHWSEDLNAQALFFRLAKSLPQCEPKKGTILFFGSTQSMIYHTAISLGDGLMIEAGGGDSATINLDIAKIRNAFTRTRPIRKDLLASFLPEYKGVSKP